MKKYLSQATSLIIALFMMLSLFNANSFMKTGAATTYEERGTLTFGSVEITLTELIENDYKVDIPITFDQSMNDYNSWITFGGFTQNGLSFYNGQWFLKNSFLNIFKYNENIMFFFGSANGIYYAKDSELASVTVVVPSTAAVGDKFTVQASKNNAKGERLTWCDGYYYYNYKNVVDSIITIKADPATANGDFSPGFIGRGTSDSPYLISSADDLVHLSELINNPATNPYCRNAYYKQTQDIDMSGIDFKPIGSFYGTDGVTVTDNAVFSGVYNGNKHKITNLKVKSYSKFCGLFGRIGESGVTENKCEIYHLSVYGDVSSSNSVVGGIVGEIGYGASVWDCSFHGNVSGSDSVGGIAGSIYEGGNIKWSYFNGKAISSGSSSGIVASVNIGNTSSSKSTTIKSCYTNGTLSGSETYAIISNYKIGNKVNVSLSLDNNYFSSNTSESGTKDDLVGCTRLSDTALKACADMLANEYSSDLDMINDGYPIFEWELSPYQFEGSGTISDPYQIGTKEDLFGLQRNVAVYSGYNKAYYIQTSDIDMENELFTPIGFHENQKVATSFTGYYDGNYHVINNLYIDRDDNNYGFGLIVVLDSNAIIKNLVVYGEVTSKIATGGIVGSANNSTIENCAFIGNVTSLEAEAGGIIGRANLSNHNLEIKNCYHNGSVSGATYASGILGSSGTSIKNDGSSGTISIYNSYHANGKITAESSANSYSIVAMNMECLKGMFGDKANEHIPEIFVSNCYITTGLASNISCTYAKGDNTTSLIQSQMKQIAPDLGEAFVTNTDENLNNGYPVFKWQTSNIQGDVNADGQFNVSDLVLFQKWLLAVPDVKLSDWKSVDYTGDGILDVFDLCLMRRELIKQMN